MSGGLTGAQVAQAILVGNGLAGSGATVTSQTGQVGVRVQPIGGALTDNYDPRDKTLNLSEGVYGTSSVAAAGVAAHEAGHAVQDASGYVWGRVRSLLVPAASFGSQAAWILILVGAFLGAASGLGRSVVVLGLAFYACAVLFQLVTLPVEFDASRRAMGSLEASGALTVGAALRRQAGADRCGAHLRRRGAHRGHAAHLPPRIPSSRLRSLQAAPSLPGERIRPRVPTVVSVAAGRMSRRGGEDRGRAARIDRH